MRDGAKMNDIKYFSIPSDFDKGTVDKLERLNRSYKEAKVVETYGNITLKNFLGSGRSVELLPGIDLDRLQDYISYSRAKGIDFNYTLNASHMDNIEFKSLGMLEILNFLGKLYHIGIRRLTVALPSLMEIIRNSKYDFKMKASAICQITTPNKAREFRKMGVERMVADEYLNRHLAQLKRVNDAFGEGVEIIVNSICHKDCPGRMFHYNQISTDSIKLSSEASANYYTHRCLLRRYETIGNVLKLTWIRPEDIKYYSAIGIKHFKLQGRHTVRAGDPVRTLEGYFKGSFDGDLLEFLDMFNPTSRFKVTVDNSKLAGFIKPFYENDYFCKDDCPHCNYCENFARKIIDEREQQEVYRSAKEFFRQYDRFKGTMDSITANSEPGRKKNHIDTEFDLD